MSASVVSRSRVGRAGEAPPSTAKFLQGADGVGVGVCAQDLHGGGELFARLAWRPHLRSACPAVAWARAAARAWPA